MDTALCRHFHVVVEDKYYTRLDMDYGNRWKDVLSIFAFFGVPPLLHSFPHAHCADVVSLVVRNRVLILIASKLLRHARRQSITGVGDPAVISRPTVHPTRTSKTGHARRDNASGPGRRRLIPSYDIYRTCNLESRRLRTAY